MNKYKKQLLYYWLAIWNYKSPGLYLLVVTLIAVSFTAQPVGMSLLGKRRSSFFLVGLMVVEAMVMV